MKASFVMRDAFRFRDKIIIVELLKDILQCKKATTQNINKYM